MSCCKITLLFLFILVYNTNKLTTTINISNIIIIEDIVPTKAPIKLSLSVFLSSSIALWVGEGEEVTKATDEVIVVDVVISASDEVVLMTDLDVELMDLEVAFSGVELMVKPLDSDVKSISFDVVLIEFDVESNEELVVSSIVVTAGSNNRNRIHINYLKQS